MLKANSGVENRSYSVVIATYGREEQLARVLDDWAAQKLRPDKVVVVRAPGAGGEESEDKRQESGGEDRHSDGSDFDNLKKSDLPLVHLEADEASAAGQRNLGARGVDTEWVVFCDDDVRFGPDLAEGTLEFLGAHPEAIAVSPRMCGAGHPEPGPSLRQYYRFQAGFDDATYGAKLFGAGLSCYPCWEKQSAPVEANWLPSTMLWMRTDVFKRHKFPDFEGYSFGEDAHLTHRAWREAKPSGGKMFFLDSPGFEHLSVQSGVKTNRFHLGRMTVRNQRRIACEAMGKGEWEVQWKSLLHRGFVTAALIKGRRRGWLSEIAGIWSA